MKFKNHNVILRKSTYRNNNTLAVIMYEVFKDGHEEEFGVVTTNIADSDILADETRFAFVDTNNWGSEIVAWLDKNNLAHNTGMVGRSGWCSYPLMCFDRNIPVIE